MQVERIRWSRRAQLQWNTCLAHAVSVRQLALKILKRYSFKQKKMPAVPGPPQKLDLHNLPKQNYRPEIDGLRAFAVIAVIVNHFNKNILPSGYLGVDIFFVISGYVITSSLSGRESKNFGDFLKSFYERRIKRLVPALVFFVLITSVFTSLFNTYPGIPLKTGITSLFGLSNLYLFKQSTDYFAQSTELNPFTHTWSLGVEEQFYLLFPVLIWFSGFGRQTDKGTRNLFLSIGIMTIASLIAFINLYQTNQPAAYFLMPSRFWEMAMGCLAFISFRKRVKVEQTLERIPPLMILLGMVSVMFVSIELAVPATILIVFLSAVMLACLKDGTAVFSVFTHKGVVYIGLISYSLYLWHWGILSVGRLTIGIHLWSAQILLVLIFLLAHYSYTLIETPLRTFQVNNAPFHSVLLTGMFALMGAATIIFVAIKVNINGLTMADRLYNIANPDTKRVLIDYGNGSEVKELVTAPPWESKENSKDSISLAKCFFSRPVTNKDFAGCLDPYPTEKSTASLPSIYIFGDSHAANYAFAFRKAFPGRVHMMTVGHGCGYMSPKETKSLDTPNMNCSSYVSKVDEFVRGIKSGSAVVVGEDWRKDSNKRNSVNQERAIRHLAGISKSVGAYFILLDDVPPIGDPLLLVQKWYRPLKPKGVELAQIDLQLAELDAIGKRLENDFENSKYIKLRNGLCELNECFASIRGKPIYWNDGHITTEASEYLAPILVRQLQPMAKVFYNP